MEDEKNTTEGRDFVPTAPQQAYTPSIKSKEENLGRSDTLEDVELGHRATYIATGEAANLSQEHRDYLIARYGTLDLNPIPDIGDQDPYNWRQSKVSQLVYRYPSSTIDESIENNQSRSCCSCSHDSDIDSSSSHPCILGHCRLLGHHTEPSLISKLNPNRYSGRSAVFLETHIHPLWTPSYLADFIHVRLCSESWVCLEQQLCADGCV